MSRVWTYVISNSLGDTELAQLEQAGKTFVTHWTAHEKKLEASFQIFSKRIIVVKVNEAVENASGCSIDKLTRFIKVSESMFGVELLNRKSVAYQKGGTIEVASLPEIKDLLASGELSQETIVYNTAVATEEEFKSWAAPLKDSWLNKFLARA